MTYSGEFIEKQKTALQHERTRLEKELSDIAQRNPGVKHDYKAVFPEFGRNPEENAMEEEIYEARLSTENALELQLRDVRDALEKIDNGTYGVCDGGGELIPEERLRALPAAKNCIEHQ